MLITVWVFSHPYQGIWHDGKLYLGQALFHLNPENFKNDLFFKFGSQDQYTIFSALYAKAIEMFGLGKAPIILMVLGQCIFVVALVLCCIYLFGIEIGIWAACAVAMVARFYGGGNIISYSETFLTARNFAEPLCLFGMWLLFRRNYIRALGVMLLAAVFHPLTTLPCLLILWAVLIYEDKRWTFLALAGIAIPLLGLLGIAPFTSSLKVYDEEWWGILKSNFFIIPTEWQARNWAAVAFDASLLWFGSRFMEKRQRDLLRIILLVSVGAILFAAVTTVTLQNVLLTSIQLWRAQWIMHLFAASVIPYVAYKTWSLGGDAKFSAIFVVLAGYLHTYPASLGAALLAIFLYHQHKNGISLSPVMKKILWVGAAAMFLIKAGVGIMVLLKPDPAFQYVAYKVPTLKTYILALPLFWLAWMLLALAYYRWHRQNVAIVGMVAVMIFYGAQWDKRDGWKKYLEQDHEKAHPFSQYLKKHGEVYWKGEVLAPWILLKTPSYLEDTQAGGLLFNKGTAEIFGKRSEALAPMRLQTELCTIIDFVSDNKECQPSVEVVKEACEISPELDAMILPWKIDGIEWKKWATLLPGDDHETAFYLYQCDSFRK
jgi:hypothetical protein